MITFVVDCPLDGCYYELLEFMLDLLMRYLSMYVVILSYIAMSFGGCFTQVTVRNLARSDWNSQVIMLVGRAFNTGPIRDVGCH